MLDVGTQVVHWALGAASLGAAAGYFGKILREPLSIVAVYAACRLCGRSKDDAAKRALGEQKPDDNDQGEDVKHDGAGAL